MWPTCLEGKLWSRTRSNTSARFELHLSQATQPLALPAPCLALPFTPHPQMHPNCLCLPTSPNVLHYLYCPLLVAFAFDNAQIPPTLVVLTFSIAQTFCLSLPLSSFPFSLSQLFPSSSLLSHFICFSFIYCAVLHALPHRPSLLLIQKCSILLAACEIFGNYLERIFIPFKH